MICKIVLIFYKDINKFLRTDVLLCSCAFVLVIYFHVILNLTNVYENVPPPLCWFKYQFFYFGIDTYVKKIFCL